MAIIACENRITCPECFDPPVLNLSADRPDPAVHFGIGYGGGPGPIGSYGAQGCKSWVWSSVSQERANMLAAAQSALCDDPCPVPPCDDDPCLTPPCPPPDGDGDGDGGGGGGNFFATSTCTINCPDGTAFQYSAPTDAGVSSVSQQEADAFAASICEQQAHLKQICFSNLPACTCYGGLPVSWSWTITATGGTPPYTFYPVTGLPPNFTLDPTGVLSGILNAAGIYPVPIQVVDVDGNTNTKTFDIVALEIVTTTLPDGAVGDPYAQTLVSNPVGTGTWILVSGSLPLGLTLGAGGVISGTPIAGGTSSFKIGLVHPSCTGTVCARDLTITVTAFKWIEYTGLLRHGGAYFGFTPGDPNWLCAPNTVTIAGPLVNVTAACSLPIIWESNYVPGSPCVACGDTDTATFAYAAEGNFVATEPGTCQIVWTVNFTATIAMGTVILGVCTPGGAGIFGYIDGWLDTYLNSVLVDAHHEVCAANFITPNPHLIATHTITQHVNVGDVVQYIFEVFATAGDGCVQTSSATFSFTPDP